ncbi:hypothetical protein jhhlp_004914 [Lomentospora prolificans]|uniref:Beta-apo-4'-carotenal oxygenase n=1 Tax=Lomentospora prolificans TaxID=41688 RepID=A0A2N3N7V4_9PEZI|nr:hypothetical protein jhhlp_004914 [Lomentospora prolificans]
MAADNIEIDINTIPYDAPLSIKTPGRPSRPWGTVSDLKGDDKTRIAVPPVDLVGKWIIISGSNNGIGREAALQFASWGANLILACRDPPTREKHPTAVVEECKEAAMNASHTDSTIEWWEVDFAKLQSVESFARRWLDTGRPLDILCNNAGMGSSPAGSAVFKTEDGFEIIHQVNFLSHVLLTLSLIPSLSKAATPRIVCTTSVFHFHGDFDLRNCNGELGIPGPEGVKFYQNNKLWFQVWLTELQRRLIQHPELRHITINGVHPGYVNSGIWNLNNNGGGFALWLKESYIKAMAYFYAIDEQQGSMGIVNAATQPNAGPDPDTQGVGEAGGRGGGRYFNRIWEADPMPHVKDPDCRQRVWRKVNDELKLEERGLLSVLGLKAASTIRQLLILLWSYQNKTSYHYTNATMPFSTAADFDQALAAVRNGFASGKTKDKKWRKRQLQKLWWMVEDNKGLILEALKKDLNKHPMECNAEFGAIQNEILDTIKNLDSWTADERPARSDFLNFVGGTRIRKEPLGVSLIIGAWNFPWVLLLQPVVAGIAAGCALILKPSDLALASQDLMMQLIPKYLDQDAIRCITAGPKEMGYILEHRFDHIFYTGSPGVAKIVSAAAAKHLTPVCLELGGQGPAIICPSADIKLAAKRVAAAKFMNAGQICLNVNHVFVDPSVHDEFITHLISYFDEYLQGRDGTPEYYGHIINQRNFDRLEGYLQKTSGKIVYETRRERDALFFGPVIVENVQTGDVLLSEELFGPILPVLKADLTEAIATIRSMEHPLALYAFTNSQKDKDLVLGSTLSGGITFNDCFLHATAKGAPFGGVGNSGTGQYHGKWGLLEFTHLRTCIDPPNWLERLMAFRYPPYTLANSKKVGVYSQAPFDRDGKPIRGSGSWLVAIGLAAAATAWGLVKTGRLPSPNA